MRPMLLTFILGINTFSIGCSSGTEAVRTGQALSDVQKKAQQQADMDERQMMKERQHPKKH